MAEILLSVFFLALLQLGKHASDIRVLQLRSLAEEYAAESINRSTLESGLEMPDSGALLYVLLRAADRFHGTYGYYPGVVPASFKVRVITSY